MPPRPKTADGGAWMPVNTAGLVALVLFGLFLMRWMAHDADGFLVPLDSLNLAIHEFGHPLFGVFGHWPMVWGGTLMELLVPAALAGVFIYKRSALSAAFCAIWFFENFHYIARYIADARALELPLAGGGEHDWNELLYHYGLLLKDTQIAAKVDALGYIGIAVTLGLAVAVWLAQRGRQPAAQPSAQSSAQPTTAPAAADPAAVRAAHYKQPLS